MRALTTWFSVGMIPMLEKPQTVLPPDLRVLGVVDADALPADEDVIVLDEVARPREQDAHPVVGRRVGPEDVLVRGVEVLLEPVLVGHVSAPLPAAPGARPEPRRVEEVRDAVAPHGVVRRALGDRDPPACVFQPAALDDIPRRLASRNQDTAFPPAHEKVAENDVLLVGDLHAPTRGRRAQVHLVRVVEVAEADVHRPVLPRESGVGQVPELDRRLVVVRQFLLFGGVGEFFERATVADGVLPEARDELAVNQHRLRHIARVRRLVHARPDLGRRGPLRAQWPRTVNGRLPFALGAAFALEDDGLARRAGGGRRQRLAIETGPNNDAVAGAGLACRFHDRSEGGLGRPAGSVRALWGDVVCGGACRSGVQKAKRQDSRKRHLRQKCPRPHR